MKRKKARSPIGPGVRQENVPAKMSVSACDIAVSEMTGVPLDLMCGWILVTVDHPAQGGHRSLILQGCGGHDDDEWAANWLEQAAADIRTTL